MERAVVVTLLGIVAGCRTQEKSPPSTPPPTSSTVTATVNVAPTPSSSGMPTAGPATSATHEWNFDSDAAGSSPKGFSFGRTGEGRDGKWLVRAEPGAPSGSSVLAQTDADSTDNRFPVAFTVDVFAPDVELSVKCKPVSGSVDRACGLVLRLSDANNYYLTRANALENNVRLYFVKNGHRQQVASWSGTVTAGVWHDLRMVAQGDHFEVHWDGNKVIDHRDATFASGGHVGVWTKADSITYFDNLSVKALHGDPK